MHILSWLAVDGTAAIVEFPGVLYRGGAEQKIRQYLIDNNYIDAVIQLPPDLFFGTTIATCIIVLRKSKRDNATLFIDASAEFTRGGNKNKLLPEHQRKILDAFTAREDVEHFARLVHNEKIAENGYNIAVSSYVEQKDEREEVDIKALNAEIARIVSRQSELRNRIDAIVAELEGEGEESLTQRREGAKGGRNATEETRCENKGGIHHSIFGGGIPDLCCRHEWRCAKHRDALPG